MITDVPLFFFHVFLRKSIQPKVAGVSSFLKLLVYREKYACVLNFRKACYSFVTYASPKNMASVEINMNDVIQVVALFVMSIASK